MSYEIRYSDQPQDRRLTREQALKEMREFASEIDFVDIRPSKDDSEPTRSFLGPVNVPGAVFIGVFTPPEANYDDWVTVESEEFTSEDAALDFLHEAGLVHLVKGSQT